MFLQGTHAFMGILRSPKRSALILQRPASFVRNRIKRRIAILVVFFVVGLIFAAAHTGEPLGIILIPCNGLAQSFVESDRGFPANLRLDFLTVKRVAGAGARRTLPVWAQS